MDFYGTHYKRYLNADDETRECTKKHWIRCHANAIVSKNETMILHSARILAAYALADNGMPYGTDDNAVRHGRSYCEF